MSFVMLTANLIANALLGWFPIIASVLMGALGALLLLVSLGYLFQTLWLLCCGHRVIATVVDYRNEQGPLPNGHGSWQSHSSNPHGKIT